MERLTPTGQCQLSGARTRGRMWSPTHCTPGSALLAGEDVEAHLGPVVDALRDFDGLVFGVIGGIDAVDGLTLPVGREVRVQLDHGGAGGYGVGAVDLNLVVALRAQPRTWSSGCTGKRTERQWHFKRTPPTQVSRKSARGVNPSLNSHDCTTPFPAVSRTQAPFPISRWYTHKVRRVQRPHFQRPLRFPCPAIQNGPQSSTRRARSTPSAARSSPA